MHTVLVICLANQIEAGIASLHLEI